MIVKVEDAKVHLESLLRRVTNGEEITITDNGIAVARLIPVVESKTNREFGIDEGKVWISEDLTLLLLKLRRCLRDQLSLDAKANQNELSHLFLCTMLRYRRLLILATARV